VCRRDDESLIHWRILQKARGFSELQWRYFAWNLYRFVEKVDGEIGLVLDALEASRFRENTIVIFSSDHGEAAGRHRMFQKFTLYEESVRTPLIVASLGESLPVGKGNRTHRLVSGVDLPATVCDYAGVPAPAGSHGRSLRPLVEGRDVPWRDSVYIESNYWGRAVVTDRHKYVTEYRPREEEDYLPPGHDDSVRGIEQLFDLNADPWETRNLAGDPDQAAVLTALRDVLAGQQRRLQGRPLAPGRPRDILDRWGARLRQRWAAYRQQ
jgi:arylsulfatase A-like enzyme